VKIKEEKEVDVLKSLDSDGNTCLIIAAIKSNIKIAKVFLVHPELIDAKNHHGIDAISISIYNNDNLMFFLLANNLNTNLQNVLYLCKIAIRMENYDILDYLTKRLSDVFYFLLTKLLSFIIELDSILILSLYFYFFIYYKNLKSFYRERV